MCVAISHVVDRFRRWPGMNLNCEGRPLKQDVECGEDVLTRSGMARLVIIGFDWLDVADLGDSLVGTR